MKPTIGQSIAFYRKKAGLTQEDLAEKLNVTSQAVSKWENDLSYPDLESTGRLATALHTTVDSLLYGEDPSAAVRLASTDQPEKRLLSILVQKTDDFDIKFRVPVELVLLAQEEGRLQELLDDEDAVNMLEPAVQLIRQGVIGPIVDFQKDDLTVRIEVIDYDR